VPHKTHLARLSAAASLLLFAAGPAQALPANKCVIDGQVTYQQGPCPTGQVRRPPTVAELNAREKQQRAAAAAAAAATTASSASASPPATSATRPPSADNKPAPTAPLSSFRCDGRQHCSQMTSCAEAKYFLAHCPGVKMDGDHDGIPCELDLCR